MLRLGKPIPDSQLLPLAAAVLGVTPVEDHQICQVLIVATTAASHLRVVSRMAMTPGEVTVVQENQTTQRRAV